MNAYARDLAARILYRARDAMRALRAEVVTDKQVEIEDRRDAEAQARGLAPHSTSTFRIDRNFAERATRTFPDGHGRDLPIQIEVFYSHPVVEIHANAVAEGLERGAHLAMLEGEVYGQPPNQYFYVTSFFNHKSNADSDSAPADQAAAARHLGMAMMRAAVEKLIMHEVLTPDSEVRLSPMTKAVLRYYERNYGFVDGMDGTDDYRTLVSSILRGTRQWVRSWVGPRAMVEFSEPLGVSTAPEHVRPDPARFSSYPGLRNPRPDASRVYD